VQRVLRLKDAVLREFGDHGADTLARYFVQLQYTALWCFEMLHDSRGIIAVIPEGVEDIVLDRGDIIELHQVKTRDESQGPWTTVEVIPILCKLYHHRKAFGGRTCRYHFTSDRMAEPRLKGGTSSLPPLYRLKYLLQINHDGYVRSAAEETELMQIEEKVLPSIQIGMKQYRETLSIQEVRQLLQSTVLDTDSVELRNPDCIGVLSRSLESAVPAESPRTTNELREIVDRVILKILRTIILTSRLADRRLQREDVLSCRGGASSAILENINLDTLSGTTVIEKKALLGGFDRTEVPVFQRQKVFADATIRELIPLGYKHETDKFITQIIDQQLTSRDFVCRVTGVDGKTGPEILRNFRESSARLLSHHGLPSEYVDLQFCLGLLWRETDLCSVWWHSPTKPAAMG
jgi:hypothetical protein